MAEPIKLDKVEQVKVDKKAKALASQKERDRQLVKGIFRFHEVQGGILEFCYRIYKGEPMLEYKVDLGTEFRDGQKYEIPYGVARHLNTSGRYPEYEYIKTPDGKSIMKLARVVARYGFEPLDFMPTEDIGDHESSNIYTTETI